MEAFNRELIYCHVHLPFIAHVASTGEYHGRFRDGRQTILLKKILFPIRLSFQTRSNCLGGEHVYGSTPISDDSRDSGNSDYDLENK